MSIEQLLSESQRYGSSDRFVLLGGGNTSYKKDGVLYVKASGSALATITEKGFVKMDLASMANIWANTYSDDDDEREEEVLADMMACRLEGESARPSVEALLHALLPFTYVVHLHPALVNGITCSQEGERAITRLFPEALWIELVKPGFILAKIVRERLALLKKKTGKSASVIFLQNHGVFVGGESLEEIATLYDSILKTIEGQLVRKPDFTPLAMDAEKRATIEATLEELTGKTIVSALNAELSRYLASEDAFAPVASSFTPDHIVYSGFKPLWVGEGESVAASFGKYEKLYGNEPKIICVQNTGVFSVGEKPLPLFLDTVSVSVFTESFGGPLFMDEAMILFIRNWEVEKYRSTLSAE
ncbi:MAG TPA: class II aldolase/adducin family protein [Sphaerochaeta sp.]|nr:class II aldolase/adducin family protein [Sphaerochaeta sp.]